MRFNLNDSVKVKLTAAGRAIHRQNFDALFRGKHVIDYEPPKEDAEGWSSWQLWSLMNEFGPYMALGGEPPIEIEIEIPDATWKL